MRIDSGLAGWGLFFILVGAIPLAAQQGLIPSGIEWWTLWPLVVIGVGLSIVLRRTALAALGGLLIAGTMGAIIGGTIATGPAGGLPIGCTGSTGQPFASQTGSLTDPTVGVELDLGCGDLDVGMTDGTGWTVAGSSDDGVAPFMDTGPDHLNVRTAEGASNLFGDRSDWQVLLPRDPAISLSASVSAGSGDLILEGANLVGVSIDVNAGATHLDLSAIESITGPLSVSVNAASASIELPALSMSGDLTANAGSVDLCAPSGVALRIRATENLTAGYDYDEAGLVEVTENVWETPGFADATTRIELSTTANAGGFSLNPEDGCQ